MSTCEQCLIECAEMRRTKKGYGYSYLGKPNNCLRHCPPPDSVPRIRPNWPRTQPPTLQRGIEPTAPPCPQCQTDPRMYSISFRGLVGNCHFHERDVAARHGACHQCLAAAPGSFFNGGPQGRCRIHNSNVRGYEPTAPSPASAAAPSESASSDAICILQ